MAQSPSVHARFNANTSVIRELLFEITEKIKAKEINAAFSGPTWADVGDLAHIRSCLNNALGREDVDPPDVD